MSSEPAFEPTNETNLLPTPERARKAGEHSEQDLATRLEMHDAMTYINHRLAEHRSQPLILTFGDVVTWGMNTILVFTILGSIGRSGDDGLIASIVLGALLIYNRSLHKLDIMRAALTLQDYDQRWIGSLFEAMAWPNRRIRRIVRLKLVNLIPLLKESDTRYLSQEHRHTIYTALQETRDSDLKIAIMQALPRFGDSTALAIVERLAAVRAFTPKAHLVQHAARVCLPLLYERIRQTPDPIREQFSTLSPFAPANTPVEIISERPPQAVSQTSTPAPEQDNSALIKLGEEREKVARPAMRMGFLIADWFLIVPYCGYMAFNSFASRQPLEGLLFTGLTVTATQLYRVSLSSTRVAMMRKQAKQSGINGVGALAEALAWPDRDIQYEAGTALTRLLPELKANHASLLTAPQRQCLHDVLKLSNSRTQSGLMIAILRAFQQVGDNAAIPYVEQLANAAPKSALEKLVVEEAQECLPYLRLCAGNNSASHSLLRASAMTETGAADNLLRPSWENPETRPEQLLRPSDTDTI